MRRLLTFLGVAAVTALGSLSWLHDGELGEAIHPALAELSADDLAAWVRGAPDEASPGEP